MAHIIYSFCIFVLLKFCFPSFVKAELTSSTQAGNLHAHMLSLYKISIHIFYYGKFQVYASREDSKRDSKHVALSLDVTNMCLILFHLFFLPVLDYLERNPRNNFICKYYSLLVHAFYQIQSDLLNRKQWFDHSLLLESFTDLPWHFKVKLLLCLPYPSASSAPLIFLSLGSWCFGYSATELP